MVAEVVGADLLGSMLASYTAHSIVQNINDYSKDQQNLLLDTYSTRKTQIQPSLTGGSVGGVGLYSATKVGDDIEQKYLGEAVGNVSKNQLINSVLAAGGLSVTNTEETAAMYNYIGRRMDEAGWSPNSFVLAAESYDGVDRKIKTAVAQKYVDEILKAANDYGAYNTGEAENVIKQGDVVPVNTIFGETPAQTIKRAMNKIPSGSWSNVYKNFQYFLSNVPNDVLNDNKNFCLVYGYGGLLIALTILKPKDISTKLTFGTYTGINAYNASTVSVYITCSTQYIAYTSSGSSISKYDYQSNVNLAMPTAPKFMFTNGVIVGQAVDGCSVVQGATLPNFAIEHPSESIDNWAESLTDVGRVSIDGTSFLDKFLDIAIDAQTGIGTGLLTQADVIAGLLTDSLSSILSSNIAALQGIVTTLAGSIADVFQVNSIASGHVPIADFEPLESSTSLYTVYVPTMAQLNALGSELWTPSVLDILSQIFTNNPLDAVISCHDIYIPVVTSGAKNIHMGAVTMTAPGNVPYTNLFTQHLDCGSCSVKELFGNVLDYYPYTRLSLYLPFIGFMSLDVSECMGSILNVHYNIDILTGECVAFVEVRKEDSRILSYTFVGNCAVQIPLTARDRSSIISSLYDTAVSIGGLAGGNPFPAIHQVGKAANGGYSQNVVRAGSLGGNAGALGVKHPFVVVTHQKDYNCNFNSLEGLPNFTRAVLGTLHGYTECEATRLINLTCTQEEKNLIENELKNGVII